MVNPGSQSKLVTEPSLEPRSSAGPFLRQIPVYKRHKSSIPLWSVRARISRRARPSVILHLLPGCSYIPCVFNLHALCTPTSLLSPGNSPAYQQLLLSVRQALTQNIPKLNSFLSASFPEKLPLFPLLVSDTVVHKVSKPEMRVYSNHFFHAPHDRSKDLATVLSSRPPSILSP